MLHSAENVTISNSRVFHAATRKTINAKRWTHAYNLCSVAERNKNNADRWKKGVNVQK